MTDNMLTRNKDRLRFFMSKIEKKPNGCWIWGGYANKDGYGMIGDETGRAIRAHRFSFMKHKGEIADGLFVCHSCDNKKCVNPDHLWLGTAADNNKDRDKKGRSWYLFGNTHPSSKLTKEKVVHARIAHKDGFTVKELAAHFGVHYNTMRVAIKGVNWKQSKDHIGPTRSYKRREALINERGEG